MVAATVIHLDEVEVPVDEVKFAVLFLMTREAHADAPCMTPLTATGVVTGIGVDAGLQTELVDVVHQRAHAVRKPLGVKTQMTVLAASVPVAVVDVHIEIAGFLQTVLVHGISLSLDEVLVDVEGKRVP